MAAMPARRGGRGLAAALGPYVARAKESLEDPAVRAKVIKQGKVAVEVVAYWLARRDRSTDGHHEPSLRVVHGRLQRRVVALRTAVSKLSEGTPTLEADLVPVVEALDAIDRSLITANALPFSSRRNAHKTIKSAIEAVESSLFATTIAPTPQGGDDV